MAIYTGDFCYKCMKSIEDDEDAVYCPSCGKFFHESCWLENGGCTSQDCDCTPEKIEANKIPSRFRKQENYEIEGNGLETECLINANSDDSYTENVAVVSKGAPKPERVLAKTKNISEARVKFFIMLWTTITVFITGVPFFIVGVAEYEEWCFIVTGVCFFAALICGFITRLLYLKAVCVTVTTKRVMFTTPFKKEYMLPLDLITGVIYSSAGGHFGVVSASIKCGVSLHKNAREYYSAINKSILDRQSNII